VRKLIAAVLAIALLLIITFVNRHKFQELESRELPSRDLRVVLGYKDTRPTRYVGDVYESAYIAAELKKMGFQRDPHDDNLFVWPQAPLQSKRHWTVRLVHSAAGPDDDDNRKNPWQQWLSLKSQLEFVDGLKKADAVFYVGHSRLGGGPDFDPPRLAKNQHVDYAYYQKTKPGLQSLRLGLGNADSKLKFLGLYSCSSGPHFEQILKKKSPAVQLKTTSEAIYYIDSLDLLMEGIKSQLEPKT